MVPNFLYFIHRQSDQHGTVSLAIPCQVSGLCLLEALLDCPLPLLEAESRQNCSGLVSAPVRVVGSVRDVIIRPAASHYHPGADLSFWVLALDRDLRIASDVLGNIYVRDPTGIKVKLWEQILFTGAGSKRYSLPLSRYARTGLWTIEVVIEGEIFSRQVNVTTRPFPTERKVAIAQRHYVELRFMSEMKKTYKPGLPFVGMIESVSSEKAIRVRVKVLDDITAIYSQDIEMVRGEGMFVVPAVISDADHIIIQAELVSVDGKEIDSHYVLAKEVIKKWTSNSDCYLLIEGIQHTLEPQQPVHATVISSCPCSQHLHYMVVTEGHVTSWSKDDRHEMSGVTVGQHIFDNATSTSVCKFNFTFGVDSTMAPVSNLVVYYVDENQTVVTDLASFRVNLSNNKISTIFDSEKQYAPGEKIEMQVFAEHDSTVCLIGGRGGDSSFEHRFPYKELDLSQSGVSLFDSAPCISSSPSSHHPKHRHHHYSVFPDVAMDSTWLWRCFNYTKDMSSRKIKLAAPPESGKWYLRALVLSSSTSGLRYSEPVYINVFSALSVAFELPDRIRTGEVLQVDVKVENNVNDCVDVSAILTLNGGALFFGTNQAYIGEKLRLGPQGATSIVVKFTSTSPGYNNFTAEIAGFISDSCQVQKSLRTDNIQQVWNEESLGTFTQSSSLLVLAEGQVKTRTESAYFCANEQLVTLSASDNHYKWLPAPRNKDGVFIAVTSSSDVMIVLSGKPKTSPQMYTVTLGMGKSWISRGKHAYGVYLTHTSTPHLLSQNTPSVFWITWDAGLLTVGRQWEPRNQTLLQWPLDKKFKVNNIGFKSAFEHAAQFRVWNYNEEAGFSQVLHLDVPKSILPGTEKGLLLLAGGLAVPAYLPLYYPVRGSDLGLAARNPIHALKSLPRSLAEHTSLSTLISSFSPALLLDSDPALVEFKSDIVRHLEQNLQKLFQYRLPDYSFGDYANTTSLWNTISVLELLTDIQSYVGIDPDIYTNIKRNVQKYQQLDGRFADPHDTDGQTDVETTAFALSVLVQVGVENDNDSIVIAKGRTYLESQRNITDSLTLSIVTYALLLTKSEKAESYLAKLTASSINEEGDFGWQREDGGGDWTYEDQMLVPNTDNNGRGLLRDYRASLYSTSNMELTDTLELRTNSAPCPLELPSLPTKVFVYSTGAGCATIQGLVTYSTYSVRSSNSVLDIRGEVLQEYLPGRPPSSGKYPRLLLKTCLRWKGQKPSGGVKVEVSLFSGFRLESVQHVNTADMTYDSRGDQIWFVFPNIKSSCVTCVEYFVLSHFTLESLRPAFVRAYPSSQPFMEVASFFHAKLSSPLTEGATGDDFETWFGANYTEPQNIFQNQCECHRACHKNNHRNKNHTTNTKPAIQSSATLESSTQTTDTKLAIQPSSTPDSAIQPSSTPDSAIQSESTPPGTKSPSTTTQSSTTSIKTPEIESGNLKITRENFNKKVMKKSPNNIASTLGYSAGRSDISDNVTEDVNARKSVETSENLTGETSVNGTKIVDKISKPLDKTIENVRKTIDTTSNDSEKVTRDVNATKTNTEDKQPGIASANARRAIHRSSDLSKEAENTNGKESYSNSKGANSNANETNSKTNETSSNSKETISNINGTNSNTNKTDSNTSKTDTRNKIPMDTVNPTTPRYEDHSITFLDNSEDEGVNRTNELVRTKAEPKIVIDDIVKEHFVVTFAPRIIVDKKSNTGPVGGDVNVKQVDVITKVANLVVEPERKKSSGLRDIVGADSKESSGLRDETNENISVKNVAKENEIAKVADIARDKSEKSSSPRDQTNEKTSLMKVAKEKSVDKNHDMTDKIQKSPKKLADSKLKKLVDTKVKKYNNVINTIIKLRQANTKELEAVKTQGKSPVKRDTSSQNKRSTTEVTTTLGIPKTSDVHTTADAETTTEFPKTTTYIPKTNNEFSETITTHIPKTTTEFTEKITTHIPKTPTTEFPKTTIEEVPETTTTRIPTTSDIPKTKLEPFTSTTSETPTPSEPTIDTTNLFQTTQQNEIPDTEHQRAYFHLIQSDEITITKPLGAGKLVSNSRTEDRMETSNSVGFGKADSSIGTDNSPLGTESSPIGTAEPSSIGAYSRPVGNEDSSVGPNYGPFGTAQNSIGSSNTPHGRSIDPTHSPIQSSSGGPPESVTVRSPIHFSLNDPSIPMESSESSILMKISTIGSSDLNPIGRKEPLTSIDPVGTGEPLNLLEPKENPRLMGLSEPLAPIGTGNPTSVGLSELSTSVEAGDNFRSIGKNEPTPNGSSELSIDVRTSQSFVQSSSEVPIQSLTSEVPTESLTSDVPTQSSTESPTQSSPSQRPSEPSQVTSTLNPTPKLVENITHRTLPNPTPRLDENITPRSLPNSTPKLVENITPQSLPNPTPRLDEIITPRALPIAEDKQLDEVVLDSDTVDAEDTVLIRQERVKKTVSL
ncbi:hypothetical protein M8J75_007824 [Diaphorina citri]|nr:hypothetical protein M8J75_007824 [Diaphorina citri]